VKSDPPVSGPRAKGAASTGPGRPVTRGLPSIEQARADRRRARLPGLRFWKWSAIFIAAGIILWWKLEQGAINRMRNELLSRQRAVRDELGPRWFPLRDKVERWTAECAAPNFKPLKAPELVDTWDFRKLPGIYLRLAQKHADSAESIREAATKSLRDGFTSCLLLVPNPNPLEGDVCETTEDCQRGQLCNDYQHCAEHSQPFNLRTAYRTMHVMSPEWVADIQQINQKLTLRGATATFEAANKYDLPVAVELLTRSKFFLVVVDEDEPIGEKGATEAMPEGAEGHDDRSILTAPHRARVCLWRLADDEKMLAVRSDASGMLVGAADKNIDLEARIAQQRQANSCALALTVRELIGATPTPGGNEDEPAPGKGASPEPTSSDAGARVAPSATGGK
jgi:hypothetical protein